METEAKFQKVVGIGEMCMSDNPQDVIVAPNLGSCLGIIAYDSKRRFGGVVHCLLPLSKKNPEKANKNPTLFVDTGLSELLNTLFRGGSTRDDIKIAVAGGSSINDQNNVFEIGRKNYTIFRKILWKNGLLVEGEHIGGNSSRTVRLDIKTGAVTVKTGNEELKIL